MLNQTVSKDPKQADVLESIRNKLTFRGFEIIEFKGVDIAAKNPNKAGSDILIEVKAPKAGYVTLDNVAQINNAAQAYQSEFKEKKVKPILIGNYTVAGSTQSVAGLNEVQLIQIDSGDTLGIVSNKLDQEFDKIITDVS
jgi:hypothetical protein